MIILPVRAHSRSAVARCVVLAARGSASEAAAVLRRQMPRILGGACGRAWTDNGESWHVMMHPSSDDGMVGSIEISNATSLRVRDDC